MKLFEDMQALGDSVTEALRKMIVKMFGVEVSESEIAEVADKLKISDLLILDQAYTNNDKNAAARILGKDIQLEYSMGGRGDVNSSATTRPAPNRRGSSANKDQDQPGSDSTQTTRNYSGGVQNGVTTKNIDNEDDPDQVMTDEPLEEVGVGAPDYNPARGGYNREDEEDTQYAVIHYPDTSISYIIRRPHDDWEHIYDPSYGYEGPVDDMDLEMAVPVDHEKVPMRLRESNVIDMVAYLKRMSGIK